MRARRALVVDDDPSILEVLAMRLEAMGLEVRAATNPAQALQLLDQTRFDVALADLRMEPMDGVALMMAAHERQPRLPVVIMTAHGTIDSAVEAIKRGAFDYLTKPFVAGELSGKIARALAQRRWAGDLILLRSVGEALASSGTMDGVLEAVARATLEATETERVCVFLREGEERVLRASAGAFPSPVEGLLAVAEAVMERGGPVHLPQADGSVLLAAPLLVDGAPEGALVVENPAYVQPTEEDLELLAVFASQAAAAIKSSKELSRLRTGALEALGRVAMQVAHEVNNPLGGLKIQAHLLEDRLKRAGDQKGVDLTQRIQRTVDQLADLVGDITAYGRPAELRREPTRIEALLDESLALVQGRLAAKGIRLVRDLDEGLGEAMLDPREMRKVVLNLVVNAVDAMDLGGMLSVRTRRLDERHLELSVEDTGCGMDGETQARIFDLFFTTKVRGTGLGMAIARNVVERHGGRLEVRSEPGAGTQIRIRLPIRPR